MRKPKCWVSSLILGLVVAGVANPAQATMYTIGNGGLQSGWSMNIDGTTESGYVGGILLTPTAGPAITSVCLDVKGTVYLGTAYNFVTLAFSGQDGLNPNWGYGNGPGNPALTYSQKLVAAKAIQNAAYVFDQHKSVLAGSSDSLKAALQLAVWEALYDTGNSAGFSFSNPGRFEAWHSSSTAATTALSWLVNDLGLYGNTPHTQYAGNLLQPLIVGGLYEGQPNTAAQEMMGILTPAVPEPTTIIAGALLLLPFGASTISFLRRNVANAGHSSRS